MDFVFFTFCHSLAGRRHPNERTRKLLVRPLQRRSLSACVLMSPFVTNALFLICSPVQFSEQQIIYAHPVSDYLHDILNDSSEHPFAHAAHCNCLWIRLSMRVNESGWPEKMLYIQQSDVIDLHSKQTRNIQKSFTVLSFSLLIYIPTVNQTFNLIPLLCIEYAWVVFKPSCDEVLSDTCTKPCYYHHTPSARLSKCIIYNTYAKVSTHIYIYRHAGVWLPNNMWIREVSEENLEEITMNLQNSHHIMIFPCRGPVQKQRQSRRLQPQGFTLPVARCSPYSLVWFFFRLVIEIFWIRLMNLDDTCDTYISDYHIDINIYI